MHCSVEYSTRWKPKGDNYCSKTCAVTASPRRIKSSHPCKNCEEPIQTQSHYCSEECKLDFASKKKRTPEEAKQSAVRAVVNYRQRTKLLAMEYLGGKCMICGYDKCPGALDFHHRDPSAKEFGISKKMTSNIETLKPELDKCDLLCRNCHAEVHWAYDSKLQESGSNAQRLD